MCELDYGFLSDNNMCVILQKKPISVCWFCSLLQFSFSKVQFILNMSHAQFFSNIIFD